MIQCDFGAKTGVEIVGTPKYDYQSYDSSIFHAMPLPQDFPKLYVSEHLQEESKKNELLRCYTLHHYTQIADSIKFSSYQIISHLN